MNLLWKRRPATAAIGLSGSAGTPGVLKIANEANEYGGVAVGGTATKTFTVTNTGGTSVTITKSKPPVGGSFSALSSLAEGTTIAPGESVLEMVAFKPGAPGYAGGVWTINGDDASGLHEVRFSGTGSVPAPGVGWSYNGTATISAGAVQTTPASAFAAGSAFFETPLESRHLVVEYDQTIGSGTGADGQTLLFADASKATPASLGEDGGGLGFAGIAGIAVGFDTFKNAANPSNNFVGVSDGAGSRAGQLHWLPTSTSIPALRTATRHVKVETLNGTVTVWVDGAKALSTTAALPSQVLLGFTGGAGELTDVHKVANVVIGGDSAPSEPPPKEPAPASLTITNTVSAPPGSAQAETQLAFSGSCPSSFTTAALASGTSASPALTGAVAGASCSVAEAAPSGSGWRTTASINGSAAVEVTASAGKLTIPAFALLAGVNTVAFTNTYTPSEGGPQIPDPSAGGWQLNGSSVLEGQSLVLTSASGNQAGSAFWPVQTDPRNLNIEFTIAIGGGTGADGLALVFADPSRGALATSLGEQGGGLGFAKVPGLAVAFDTWKNAANPSNNFAGISDGAGASAGLLHWLSTYTFTSSLRTGTHRVKISTTAGAIAIYLDGTKLGSRATTLPSSAYIGFSGATGGSTDRHAISQLTVAPSG